MRRATNGAAEATRDVTTRLDLSRSQILAFRRATGALDERLGAGPASLRRAAWAGLQDSMPRAALLSIHARVHETASTILDDPSLVQLWGPRYSAYVVAATDRAAFTLGRLPEAAAARRRAVEIADRLEGFLAGRQMAYAEAGRGLVIRPNTLRYAAPTGRVLMRWDGARQPTVWTVPPPGKDPRDARLELARRFLHIFGPATATSFATWAGIKPPTGRATFDALATELIAVRTPIGDGWILAADEPAIRTARPTSPDAARLLPSGDTWFLHWGADRELLVPDADRRAALWTPRVWPGAVLVGGEVVGVWRRADATVTIQAWRRLAPTEREAVEVEAKSFPLPGITGSIRVRWDD
jgi:hypothetical protein